MTRLFARLQTLGQRLRGRVGREIRTSVDRARERRRPTFPDATSSSAPTVAHSQFAFLDAGFLAQLARRFPDLAPLVQRQSAEAMAHRFDLLGSGPCVVAHCVQHPGLHGVSHAPSDSVQPDRAGQWLAGRILHNNLAESQRIWRLIAPDHLPIDWQVDFKSGYRWSESTWHGDIRFARLPGVDVKVPWELARLQHLPTLGLACHFAQAHAAGFDDPAVYAQAFRNQVLDFIATNPPGFGVNWSCAMDVGIRCANLLVAHDIVKAAGLRLDGDFERAFCASVLAHARHVARHLEWSPRYRGNHYLANIAGLLFAAAYLPASDEVDAWLAFSVQELVAEVDYQFHDDGSNFEASVCYHRLSSEMVLWAFALLSNLPEDKLAVLTRPPASFRKNGLSRLRGEAWTLHAVPGSDRVSPIPPWCWARLEQMANFTKALTRPDGTVTQFGDNDSGRFIVLGSGEQLRAGPQATRSPRWSLDHGALVCGIRALTGALPDAQDLADPGAWIVRGLAGLGPARAPAPPASPNPIDAPLIGDEQVWDDLVRRQALAPPHSRWTGTYEAASPGALQGLRRHAFPGMGCYVFRGADVYLAVRCGEIGVAGLGAHAHCDQLAIELVLDGSDVVRDPGTYLYTPFPEKRNAYRSAAAHHVPHVAGREPANLSLGLFDLRGAAEGQCLYFGPRGFIGRHAGYGSWVYRIIRIEDQRISISDFAEDGLALTDSTPAPLPFSHAYGRVLA